MIKKAYASIERKREERRMDWCDEHPLSLDDVEKFTVRDAKRRGMLSYHGLYYINCEDWLNWPSGIRIYTHRRIDGQTSAIKDQGGYPQCNVTDYGPSNWGVYPIDEPESMSITTSVDE